MFSHHLRLSITLPSSSEDPKGQPIIFAFFNTSADTYSYIKLVRDIVVAQIEKFDVLPFEIKPVLRYRFLSFNKCNTILS